MRHKIQVSINCPFGRLPLGNFLSENNFRTVVLDPCLTNVSTCATFIITNILSVIMTGVPMEVYMDSCAWTFLIVLQLMYIFHVFLMEFRFYIEIETITDFAINRIVELNNFKIIQRQVSSTKSTKFEQRPCSFSLNKL